MLVESQAAYYGVPNGVRTRDIRNHNPALYQLSYGHHGGDIPSLAEAALLQRCARSNDPNSCYLKRLIQVLMISALMKSIKNAPTILMAKKA